MVFRTPAGVEYASEFKNNTYQIKVSSGLNNDGQELYALYPYTDTSYKSMGKVILVTYDLKKLDAVIVPVGDVKFNFGKLKENLNKIYGPVGIEWDVNTDLVLTNGNLDLKQFDTLNTEESEKFSMYSPEMSALNSLYKKEGKVDSKTMYLFVVKTIEGKSGVLLGDMPLSGQFGYLAASNDEKLAAKTIAHELGHGMFYLRHTFSQYNLAEGHTDNLMDYSLGTQLFKKQWDEIFDPRRPRFAWRQDEEEGAMGNNTITSNANLLQLLYAMRMANAENTTDLSISDWRKIGNVNFTSFKINSMNVTLANIHFSAIGDTSSISSWKINPAGKNIAAATHPVSSVTAGSFLKYSFYQAGSTTSALEIVVSVADTANFNKYLYPVALAGGVRLGDPKANPVVTTTDNPHYGYLGCVRTDTTAVCTYPASFAYAGKSKKHDGVDFTAAVGESVRAIYGGVVEGVPETSFEPQNTLFANDKDKDYRGLLSNQTTVQTYTYVKSNGQTENGTLPIRSEVGWYGCHYAKDSYRNKVTIKVNLDKPVKDIYGNSQTVIYMRYSHLNTISVTNGQRVEQGAVIGVAGCSGNAARIPSNQHHMHIEANTSNSWDGVRAIDPLKLITTTLTRP